MLRAIIIAIIILAIVPWLLGRSLGEKNVVKACVIGFLVMVGITALTSAIGVTARWSVNATTVFSAVILAVAFVIFSWIAHSSPLRFDTLNKRKFPSFRLSGTTILMIIAIAIIVLQCCRFIFREMLIDGDDVTYISLINDSAELNHFYMREPVYGADLQNPLLQIGYKYLFTTFYPQMAMITKMAGISAAAFSHTVFPSFVIIYSYLVWWELFGLVFKKEDTHVLAFFFWTLFMEFGQYSYYTISRRLLMYVWNSKSVCFCVLMPALLYIFLRTVCRPETVNWTTRWIGGILAMIACGSATLMGVGMAPIMILLVGVILAAQKKSLKILLYSIYLCIPEVIQAAMLYMFMQKGSLPWIH